MPERNLTEMEGYVKLHRKVIENGWLKNHSLWILWSYLLLKATHTAHKQRITIKKNAGTFTKEVLLRPGQVIFGRKKAAEDTGLSEQNIRTALKHLVTLQNINIKSTKNYSVITLINWAYYQCEPKNLTNCQPSINQVLTTNKNDKNDKNDININVQNEFERFWILYDKKVSRETAFKLWKKLKAEDKIEIFKTLPEYVKATPDKKYRKDPDTYLRNKSWNDEIIFKQNEKQNSEDHHIPEALRLIC